MSLSRTISAVFVHEKADAELESALFELIFRQNRDKFVEVYQIIEGIGETT